MSENLERHYLENIIAELRFLKKLGDRAMEQLDDEQFFVTLSGALNGVISDSQGVGTIDDDGPSFRSAQRSAASPNVRPNP